nr:MAG TPA_asm: hypothetical protein [Caudoviricetes sp.]
MNNCEMVEKWCFSEAEKARKIGICQLFWQKS